jgi:cephalosporin-C deacetylase-like acetyl esterase
MKHHRISLFVAGLLAGLLSAAQGVTITQHEDRSCEVMGKTYKASVDNAGNWYSLVIDGVEFFGDKPFKGAAFPGKEPPKSINVRGQLLAIRNGSARVEYTFDDTGIQVETEGGKLEYQMSPNVSAYVCVNGAVYDRNVPGIGDVRKVIAGKAALGLNQPFHCVGKKLYPSVLARGTKPEAKFTARIECGISPDPVELVELKSITPVGKPPALIPWFASGEVPRYNLELRNLGTEAAQAQITYVLSDRFGSTSGAEKSVPAMTVAPGAVVNQALETPPTAPGCYWVTIELRKDGKAVKREQRAFVYDGEHYKPALTRPADFAEFWKAKLAAARAVPLDPRLTPVPEKSTEVAAHYQLELTVLQGKRLTMGLQVPRKAGRYLALFGAKLGERAADGSHIILFVPHEAWPEQATYNRWASAQDNNLVDCYLAAVRIADYLRSREDVERIYLSGGSRQGPIQLANAALDPTQICAVDAHVPTCMGNSWTQYAYSGWGKAPTPAMAVYVDPVNFAQDITVPFITDVGTYDGLSPVPGALAFYNCAEKCQWKRFSIEAGGHGYFPPEFRRTAKAELDARINVQANQAMDEKILKDH